MGSDEHARTNNMCLGGFNFDAEPPSIFDSLYFQNEFLTSLSRVTRTTSSISCVMMASHDGEIPELSI